MSCYGVLSWESVFLRLVETAVRTWKRTQFLSQLELCLQPDNREDTVSKSGSRRKEHRRCALCRNTQCREVLTPVGIMYLCQKHERCVQEAPPLEESLEVHSLATAAVTAT